MDAMATTKKAPPRAKPRKPSAPAPKPTRADGRPKSKLTLEGERCAIEGKRALLLKTLDTHGWNLTATAEALEMGALANVIRALHELAPAEYEAARKDGRISHGTRRFYM